MENLIINSETKHVERYQLYISVILVLGSIAVSWNNTNNRLAVLETQQKSTENLTYKIENKLDKILDSQEDIKIKLETKENRK